MTLRRAAMPQPTRLRNYVPTLIMMALCMYFSFYLLFGPRGYFSFHRVHDTLVQKEAEYHALKDKREKLESDVHLMRPNSLDPDMAEEQVRKTLGYIKSDEVVIDLN